MPTCSHHVVLCDIPINYDPYKGCSHCCSYCFVRWYGKSHDQPRAFESVEELRLFIEGKRTGLTNWCDWAIPLHIGTVSDPFQPIERELRYTRESLKLLAEDYYPFAISTKSPMALEMKDIFRDCNCVFQVSMVSPDHPYDKWEAGAPSFRERLKLLWKIAPYVRRVIVRIQPFIPESMDRVLKLLPVYASAGVYGLTVEGLKLNQAAGAWWSKRYDGTMPSSMRRMRRATGGYYLPVRTLFRHFMTLREACHEHGLRFYAAENRLRYLGDSPTCCGVDDLSGFVVNTANLNYASLRFTPAMKRSGSGGVFRRMRSNEYSFITKESSYRDVINQLAEVYYGHNWRPRLRRLWARYG